jgi:hypothetical protein
MCKAKIKLNFEVEIISSRAVYKSLVTYLDKGSIAKQFIDAKLTSYTAFAVCRDSKLQYAQSSRLILEINAATKEVLLK